MYEHGLGVGKDYKKALEWFRKAADQGYAVAQCNLGFMYANGFGVEKNDEKALEWCRKAAEQEDPAAQRILRSMPGDIRSAIYKSDKAKK
jgi:TPR repeat protein